MELTARPRRREWPIIDRLRLDKYMVLVRRMLCHAFKYLARNDWYAQPRPPPRLSCGHTDLVPSVHRSDQLLLPMCDFLHTRVLLATDKTFSLGFSLHCTDVLLSELASVSALDQLPVSVVLPLLQPYIALLCLPGHPTLAQRAMSAVFEPLCEALARSHEDDEDGDLPTLSARQGRELAQALFDAAGEPETSSKHRAALYGLSRKFKEAAALAEGQQGAGHRRGERRRKIEAADEPLRTQHPKQMLESPAGEPVVHANGKAKKPPGDAAKTQRDQRAATPTARGAAGNGIANGTPHLVSPFAAAGTPASGHSSAYASALSHGSAGLGSGWGSGGNGGAGHSTPKVALEDTFYDAWATPGSGARDEPQVTPAHKRATPAAGDRSGGAVRAGQANGGGGGSALKRKAAQQQPPGAAAGLTPGSGPAGNGHQMSSPSKRCVNVLMAARASHIVSLTHLPSSTAFVGRWARTSCSRPRGYPTQKPVVRRCTSSTPPNRRSSCGRPLKRPLRRHYHQVAVAAAKRSRNASGMERLLAQEEETAMAAPAHG